MLHNEFHYIKPDEDYSYKSGEKIEGYHLHEKAIGKQ